MWPNPHFPADLVIFTEEILDENFIFCVVYVPGVFFYNNCNFPKISII